MEPKQNVPTAFLLSIICLIFVTAGGFLFLGMRLSGADALPRRELAIMNTVFQRIEDDYVDEVGEAKAEEMMHLAVDAMVNSLDRYCDYIPPAEVAKFEADTSGTYQGIGVALAPSGKPVTILFPFPDGPAAKAGMQVGDRIVQANEQRLDELSGEEIITVARKHLLGPPQTQVQVKVQRQGVDHEVDLTITRGPIANPSVHWIRILDKEQGLGYMHLNGFTDHTTEEFDRAAEKLAAELGHPLAGLVLDLRSNPGGQLDQCVALTNRFLAQGTIVQTKGRGNGHTHVTKAKPELCSFPHLPLVLLMNGGSASASEVLAGALQDHQRAKIVGERSYGKGVVQSIIKYSKPKFLLKITTSHYYTPKGRSIEGRMRRKEDGEEKGGIQPDIEVLLADDKERQKIIQSLRQREVPEIYHAQVVALAEQLEDYTVPQALPLAEDKQLSAALQALTVMLEEANK